MNHDRSIDRSIDELQPTDRPIDRSQLIDPQIAIDRSMDCNRSTDRFIDEPWSIDRSIAVWSIHRSQSIDLWIAIEQPIDLLTNHDWSIHPSIHPSIHLWIAIDRSIIFWIALDRSTRDLYIRTSYVYRWRRLRRDTAEEESRPQKRSGPSTSDGPDLRWALTLTLNTARAQLWRIAKAQKNLFFVFGFFKNKSPFSALFGALFFSKGNYGEKKRTPTKNSKLRSDAPCL
jgi:hypothetical protein